MDALVCSKCQGAISPSVPLDEPSVFEIEFARVLVQNAAGRPRDGQDGTSSALRELVERFDVVVRGSIRAQWLTSNIQAQAKRLLSARATNMDLETSLKIARSNLVLAEANTEALEETLRRRAPLLQPASFPGASLSVGPPSMSRAASPDINLWGESLVASPAESNTTEENGKSSISAFFRRKRTGTPQIISSVHEPVALADAGDSDIPESFDAGSAQISSLAKLLEEKGSLSKRLDHLTALLASERSATKQLRNSHADLVAERDKLNEAHGEMQDELESLSAALFEEANRMVAEERKKVAEYEEEILHLRAQLDDLKRADLDSSSTPAPTRPLSPGSPVDHETKHSPPEAKMQSKRNSILTPTAVEQTASAARFEASPRPLYALSANSPAADSSPRSHDLEEAPGRQWLKSFKMRPKASDQSVEDATTTIETASNLSSLGYPASSAPSRSLTLEDTDLAPSMTASSPRYSSEPEEHLSESEEESEDFAPAALSETRLRAIMQEHRRSREIAEGTDRRSYATSHESWNKRSTSSSFASPNIETAFLSSPPLPGRLIRSPPSATSQRSSTRRISSPRRPGSTPLRGGQRPDSPPALPTASPVWADLQQRQSQTSSPDPARSEPIPQTATFSSGFPTRSSSTRHSEFAPSLSLRERRLQAGPAGTSVIPSGMERAIMPKSARRAGLVLGLDTNQLFPHKNLSYDDKERGGARPTARAGATQDFARAVGYTAPNGHGVGLLRQIPRPETPISPMVKDLDELLEELSHINDDLDYSTRI